MERERENAGMGLKSPLVENGQGVKAAKPAEATAAYPPLSEVRQRLKPKWYRCEMDVEKFKAFTTPSDREGWFQAGGHLALYACTGLTIYLCWLHSLWYCMLVALFAHGTVGGCFGFATHELAHGTVFKTKFLNQVFLHVYSLLSWWDPYDYAMSHKYHHLYTQFAEADRENLYPLNPSVSFTTLVQLLTVSLTFQPGRVFGKGGLISHVYLFIRAACDLPPGSPEIPSHEWLITLHNDRPEEVRKVVMWSRCMLLFHGVVLALTIYTRVWVLLLIVSFGKFFANWLAFAMGNTQHAGLKSSAPDFRKNTRSIVLHPILEFLYWRMNWHIEHHMFAQVPCYNLKALHYEVAHDMPEPRTLVGAWREMWDIWARQQEEPTYEFDTPVPTPAGDAENAPESKLPVSIGAL